MRVIDPFDYWASHASAIEGLGGSERSPDPRYLFHTSYHDVQAGHARFIVQLDDVRASFGELSVRVHAWKPLGDSNVSLVAGARLLLSRESGTVITLPVNFAPQKGVRYALYGYLSEDSDLTARALQIAIDEPDDTGEHFVEPPRSVLAGSRPAGKTSNSNALLHRGAVDTDCPVSQCCTVEQAVSLGLLTTGFFGRERGSDVDAVLARWSETLCLNALSAYGIADPGLEGLVVGPLSPDYAERLARTSVLIRLEGGPPPISSRGNFFDFLLIPGGAGTRPEGTGDARERWETIDGWLARLKIGGIAILGLRYRPGDMVSSSAEADTPTLSRNEIGQWALRLIGSGYSIAPMAFAPVADLLTDQQGLAAFLLIIERTRS